MFSLQTLLCFFLDGILPLYPRAGQKVWWIVGGGWCVNQIGLRPGPSQTIVTAQLTPIQP